MSVRPLRQTLRDAQVHTYRVYYVGRVAGHVDLLAWSEEHARERFKYNYSGFRATRVELLG